MATIYEIDAPTLADVNVVIDPNGYIGIETPAGWRVFSRNEYAAQQAYFNRLCEIMMYYIAAQKVESKYNLVLPYSWPSFLEYLDNPKWDLGYYFSEELMPGQYRELPAQSDDLVWRYVDFILPGSKATTATPAPSPSAPSSEDANAGESTPDENSGEPTLTIPENVMPTQSEKKNTNLMPWICGGIAVLILIPSLFGGKKKRR